ncbi:RtcB family protein [Faecalicatena contorta]|uniref:RtcB family protein n=1 Tax=Faecalicatena contorta TaxID=39482 RepID=UPI001F3FE9AE|nr:RtcB family protein [Faecalicatena contorta]MCF2554367.1 RtcB family protein [Faecalicatena contorta]
MKIINGIYSSAIIFTEQVEEYAVAQIQMICDNEVSYGSKIRVMPDVHPGKVGTIGLTMTVGERVLPNLVGIDIGCGITLAKFKQKKVEFQKLDTVIRENIPTGSSIRKKSHRYSKEFDLHRLRCFACINEEKAMRSHGTLGAGNHFIELDKDTEGNLYVAIHTGSRHLGKEVTEYYLRNGQEHLKNLGIQIPYELTYLTGRLKENYIHDLHIVQEYAELNREIILDEMCKGMKWKVQEAVSICHNYIDEEGMLRKGAISAKKGEPVIIPINMKDGIIIGVGKGNTEWNCSAPHGSGRILKRNDVKNTFTVSNFKSEMKGIYCSCIGKETMEESPFAYRRISEIEDVIADTAEITGILKPVYNYKARK